jgi:hypothetical protein
MTSMSRLPCSALCLIVLAAACGDDGGAPRSDAAVVVDTSSPDGLPAGCNYVEQQDTTNDDFGTGTPEATNLTFTTSADTVVCGTLDASHFDGDITVDVDSYLVTVATDADVLVRMKGPGAEAIELVGVDIRAGSVTGALTGTLTYYGDHGVSSVHLTAGTYDIEVAAFNSAAITTSVPYTIAIVADNPALRCPELTTGGYLEALDTSGNMNAGNDVVRLASGTAPALTTSGTDAPEPTGLTLSPTAGDQRISGSAADIAAPDLYEDKDTYVFATSSMTNELTVRLAWTGTANLDFLLFEDGDPTPVLRAISTATTSPEARTFSIKPSSSYWLMVAAKGATGLPKAYAASLCPTHFVP